MKEFIEDITLEYIDQFNMSKFTLSSINNIFKDDNKIFYSIYMIENKNTLIYNVHYNIKYENEMVKMMSKIKKRLNFYNYICKIHKKKNQGWLGKNYKNIFEMKLEIILDEK